MTRQERLELALKISCGVAGIDLTKKIPSTVTHVAIETLLSGNGELTADETRLVNDGIMISEDILNEKLRRK